MGEIRILAKYGTPSAGDKKIQWNPQAEAEVDVAEMAFDKLVKEEGYKAFEVKKDGSKGKPVKKFKASLGMLIMIPVAGGG